MHVFFMFTPCGHMNIIHIAHIIYSKRKYAQTLWWVPLTTSHLRYEFHYQLTMNIITHIVVCCAHIYRY